MIKSENRLRKNSQFMFIYKHGKASHGANLTVVYLKTKIQPYKVGFTVSKKIGKSVVRSKIKRRLTECFNRVQKFVDSSYNYVFISKSGIENLSFFEMLEEMKKVLKKANLYNEKID